MLRRILWASPLLGACSLFFPKVAAKQCQEGTPPLCQGNDLVSCQGGFVIHQDCGDLVCNLSSGVCSPWGDGEIDAGEACDDGNPPDGDSCDSTCPPPACGNNIRDPGETCYPDPFRQ